MGNQSAGKVGAGNEGKTDMDRGSVAKGMDVTKASRKTGKVGGMENVPNSNTVDGNKRSIKDPRLA